MQGCREVFDSELELYFTYNATKVGEYIVWIYIKLYWFWIVSILSLGYFNSNMENSVAGLLAVNNVGYWILC